MIIVSVGILYLHNQRNHNYLAKIEPELSNPDSLIRSYYTYDLMAATSYVGNYMFDSLSKYYDLGLTLPIKFENVIKENSYELLSQEAPLLPEIFWNTLYKIKICDCYWRGNFFDVGEPKYHVPDLKGEATIELTLADTIKCCNKKSELFITDNIAFNDINTLEELRNKIITYYQKKANNYFHPIDIPKDTTLSVVERVSLFMKNNPSKFLNIEEIEEEVINQLEKLSTTHGNIFNKKLEITMTFKRVTQSRALLLRLIYNDYNDKVSINRDFKVGHEVQALGFEISDLEIKL